MADWREMFGFIHKRKQAYQLTYQLQQPANVIVLDDLARFCRANESCVVPGDRDKTLILEGRREVWLRIQQHLHLTEEQLMQLYSGNPVTVHQQEK
jgi:hypothetical protein